LPHEGGRCGVTGGQHAVSTDSLTERRDLAQGHLVEILSGNFANLAMLTGCVPVACSVA
jgi:hypothetical protein